jgi:hypothetical protein
MNTLTKLAINKKTSAIFADGTSKMNLGVSTVVGLLSAVDRVPVEVAPFSRSTKLLADPAESSGRQVTQTDGDGTLLVRPAVSAEPVAEELPVVESEAVAWQDMTDEQRVEIIADDKVEVEQTASVEPVAEAPEPESVETVERGAEAFQKLAPKAKTAKVPKAKVPKRSMPRQLLSVFKTRETNVQKVLDYKAALVAGDCSLPEEPLSKSLKEKIVALGLEETV